MSNTEYDSGRNVAFGSKEKKELKKIKERKGKFNEYYIASL